jgi:8-oxo-dGTP diphosphatase
MNLSDKKMILVSAVMLRDDAGRLLLAKRPSGKSMAGLWEFPGGKVETGETPETALVRELVEELDIVVAEENLVAFTFASHAYDDFHLLMPVYLCEKWQGAPTSLEGQDLAWVAVDDLGDYPMPPADIPLIEMIKRLF